MYKEYNIIKSILEKDIGFYIERNYKTYGEPEFTSVEIKSFLEDCQEKSHVELVNTTLFKLTSLDLVEMIVDEGGIKYKLTEKGKFFAE